uniref:hypothetical protein n=1 Tax=Proteus mirabilis TaxID=584 RepID=UPI001C130E96
AKQPYGVVAPFSQMVGPIWWGLYGSHHFVSMRLQPHGVDKYFFFIFMVIILAADIKKVLLLGNL